MQPDHMKQLLLNMPVPTTDRAKELLQAMFTNPQQAQNINTAFNSGSINPGIGALNQAIPGGVASLFSGGSHMGVPGNDPGIFSVGGSAQLPFGGPQVGGVLGYDQNPGGGLFGGWNMNHQPQGQFGPQGY